MIFAVEKGTGYWDITKYPIGGSFRRLKKDLLLNTDPKIVDMHKVGDRRGYKIVLPTGESTVFDRHDIDRQNGQEVVTISA